MNTSAARTPGGTAISGRSAALLIDFDNVTMNVRSDLGKEIQSLLNSEVFRGKVAVRRAYADWRRYPSSVVPMTEASVDLIFAPAYGTSKKNATDLRMAVDAIELAFMRPEIGTFILLTGDSDFSSCVMKLKEYGKYVIGVGMRESASDLLIQNCDEYYSYHNLSGLTRATDDTGVREDPWELVARAMAQMKRNDDVMRVDRLKQVMLELDPGFNEKDIGYSKFSKFIAEAQSRGVVRLHRDKQGNWELSPPAAGDAESPEERADRAAEREQRRDRERERGRDRDRERRRGRERPSRPEPQPVAAEETPAAEEPARQPEPVEAAAPEAPAAPAAPARPAAEPGKAPDPLRNAFALLQHTLRQMVGRQGEAARDGDLKRRMLDADPEFDEGKLGFSKFSRFLRAAHEAEMVDVRRQEDGGYEVLLPAAGKRLPAPVLTGEARAGAEPSADEAEMRAARGRGRGRRPEPSGPPPLLPGQVAAPPAEEAAPAAAEREPEMTPRQAIQEREDGDIVRHREPAVATARIEDPASIANRGSSTSAGSVGIRGGRGRRGGPPSGPPPLLPGQVVGAVGSVLPAEPEAARPEPAGKPGFSAEALGLSTERGAVLEHLASYKGVGRKSAEALYDAYGADVYRVIEEDPDAVRATLGRRAAPLLEQWETDRDARRAAAPQPAAPEPAPQVEVAVELETPAPYEGEAAPEAPAAEAPAAAEDEGGTRGRGRGRRGGRGRGRGTDAETDPTLVGNAAPAPEAAAEPVQSPSEQADEVLGDTDPSLVGDAGTDTAPEEKPAARSRGRRGRGRTAKAAEAEAPAPPPEPAPEPEAAAEERPARRGRGRGRAAAKKPAAETAAPAPEPAAEEAAAPRGRGRGRGRTAAKQPAAEAPPAAPAEEPAAPARRGRGRGRAAKPAEAAPEAPPAEAPAGEAKEGGAARSRSRRGGRGRGKGNGGTPAA